MARNRRQAAGGRARSGDPRRRAAAINPLDDFQPADFCWCGSGKRYRDCHGEQVPSQPGEPLPPDPEDAYYIAPGVTVAKDAFQDSVPAPITMHFPTPQAIPLALDIRHRVDPDPEPDQSGAPEHHETGSLRYALLDQLGINSADKVREGRLDRELERHASDLLDGSLDLATASVRRLAADATHNEAPPVVLHHDAAEPTSVASLVGQTLFWADHYTSGDRIAELAASGRSELDPLRDAVADLLTVRPLVEAGVIIPVLTDTALSLVHEDVDRAVAADLNEEGFVAWLEAQVVIEGPTAREAAFVRIRDDRRRDDAFFLLNRVVPGTAGQSEDPSAADVTTRMLSPYNPDHDYEPWLATVRRQGLVAAVREIESDLAIADLFAAEMVTRLPFRARALQRRPASGPAANPGSATHGIGGAVWADVPWLPQATPELLLKIASNEARVADLRGRTASVIRTLKTQDLGAQATALADLSNDLARTASGLSKELRRSSALELTVPTGLATGSVLVGTTMSPTVGIVAGMAGVAQAIGPLRALARRRDTAAYAFWMARPRSGR